jgi:hypothetical protein
MNCNQVAADRMVVYIDHQQFDRFATVSNRPGSRRLVIHALVCSVWFRTEPTHARSGRTT